MEMDYNVFVKMLLQPDFSFAEVNGLAYENAKITFSERITEFINENFKDYVDEDYEIEIEFREHKMLVSFVLVLNDNSEEEAVDFGNYLVKNAIERLKDFTVIKYDTNAEEADLTWLDNLETRIFG